MDLFDLLIIGAVIYAMLRGMARAGGKAGAPREPEEPPLEAREWSEDMGDLLEGLGFPRPSGPSRIPQAPPGQQDVHAEEAAGLATAEAREPRERIERGRALADIAAIAEAAARKRARPPEGTSRAGSLLPRLDRYSELERAILYAEILAPPKALRE
ncbi:MAG: hypothetical protein V3W35_00740 [Gemmatimonadota bacterium]